MNTAEAIKSAREQLSEMLDTFAKRPDHLNKQAILNHIALSTAEQPQPVAWMTEDGRVAADSTKQCMPSASKVNFNIPLYTAPQASQPVALTDEQKDAIYNAWRAKGDSVSYGDLIDDVERALLSATSQPSEAERLTLQLQNERELHKHWRGKALAAFDDAIEAAAKVCKNYALMCHSNAERRATAGTLANSILTLAASARTDVEQALKNSVPNFCLLIDELISSWQARDNNEESRQRRVNARIVLDAAIRALAQQEQQAPAVQGIVGYLVNGKFCHYEESAKLEQCAMGGEIIPLLDGRAYRPAPAQTGEKTK